jgi:hypothetical protein
VKVYEVPNLLQWIGPDCGSELSTTSEVMHFGTPKQGTHMAMELHGRHALQWIGFQPLTRLVAHCNSNPLLILEGALPVMKVDAPQPRKFEILLNLVTETYRAW